MCHFIEDLAHPAGVDEYYYYDDENGDASDSESFIQTDDDENGFGMGAFDSDCDDEERECLLGYYS